MTAPALNVAIQGLGATSADNLNTFQQTCDAVSQLYYFTGTQGVQVYARGFASPNDGGQGPFYWNSTFSGTGDGINVVVPGGAVQGAWIRLGYDDPAVSDLYQVPLTGFSLTIPYGITTVVLNPGGTLASGSITLPIPWRDGIIVTITSTQTITSLTLAASAGTSIVSAPSSLVGATAIAFIYVQSKATWYGILPPASGATTGTGAFVLQNGPTIVSPDISTSITGIVTGSGNIVLETSPTIITPTIQGQTSGSAVAAGDIGQIITSGALSGVSMTTATPLTIGSITLTAGFWEIWASYATFPAGSTTQSQNQAVISATTNVLTSISDDVNMGAPFAVLAGLDLFLPVGSTTVNITTTTTYYLVGQTSFATSTLTAGGIISARRIG